MQQTTEITNTHKHTHTRTYTHTYIHTPHTHRHTLTARCHPELRVPPRRYAAATALVAAVGDGRCQGVDGLQAEVLVPPERERCLAHLLRNLFG